LKLQSELSQVLLIRAFYISTSMQLPLHEEHKMKGSCPYILLQVSSLKLLMDIGEIWYGGQSNLIFSSYLGSSVRTDVSHTESARPLCHI
jgi:hypothetical protein